MASRNLNDLHPDLHPLAIGHVRKCAEQGIDLLLYCTFRSNSEQDELYTHGRTAPGPIVTNVRGGQSAHNFTLNGKPAAKAYDCVPLINGKAMWDAHHPAWKIVGVNGEALGLNWYGHPGAVFKEFPHFALKT